MSENTKVDYSVFDRPEILMFLFHPRVEENSLNDGSPGENLLIPVEEDIVIGACAHVSDKSCPNILFYHGNGEIVADYNDLGPIFNRIGINFFPVDYRGYGRSTGRPTVTSMMNDCHLIFEYLMQWLEKNEFTGPMIIMGRSLGSASALELAASYQDRISGLIIESGFAYAEPLFQLLGVNMEAMGFSEEKGFRNVDKIRSLNHSVLVIHAEYDHIIPFRDGQVLYEACSSREKALLKIPGANHNDIFFRGMTEYLSAVKKMVDGIMSNA